MTQQQLFNKIAELATMFKLSASSVASDATRVDTSKQNAKAFPTSNPAVDRAASQKRVPEIRSADGSGSDQLKAGLEVGKKNNDTFWTNQQKSQAPAPSQSGTPKSQATMPWGKATYNNYSSEGSFDKAFAKARADKQDKFYFKDSKGKENIFGTQLAKSSPSSSYKGPSSLAGTGGVPNANAIVDSVRRSGIITKVEPKGMTGGAFTAAPPLNTAGPAVAGTENYTNRNTQITSTAVPQTVTTGQKGGKPVRTTVTGYQGSNDSMKKWFDGSQ